MAAGSNSTVVGVTPWLTISISFLAVVLIPLIALLWRVAVAVTREHEKMTNVEEDIRALVQDKDKVHNAMYEQMREDRASNNQRLRWLEENLWNLGRRQL